MALPQPKSVQEFKQRHEQERAEIEKKKQDLGLAQLLSRALDPQLPPGFRQLGLKQVAERVGVDPRGDRSKEMIGLLTKLDPQSLQGLQRSVGESFGSAQPGQMTELAKGILSGGMPAEQLLAKTKEAVMPPPMKLGGPMPEEGMNGAADGMGEAAAPAPPSVPGATEPAAPPMNGAAEAPPMNGTNGGAEEERKAESQRHYGALSPEEIASEQPAVAPATADVPPRKREVEPEVNAVLGLDEQRYRIEDIHKAGWNRVPSNPQAREKLFTEVKGSQGGVVDTLTMANQLNAFVTGRPEALDFFAFKIFGNEIRGNLPSFGTDFNKMMEGWANIAREERRRAGLPEQGLPEGTFGIESYNKMKDGAVWSGEADKVADTATKLAQEKAEAAGKPMPMEEAAIMNARIRAAMVPLAFAMAAAKGQTGRFLSDQDVALQLRELGDSATPEKFNATLADMTQRIVDGYNSRMKTQLGKEVPIGGVLTPAAMEAMEIGGLKPKGMEVAAKMKIERADPLEKGEAVQEAARVHEAKFKEEQRGAAREQWQMARESHERMERGEQRAIEREERAEWWRRAEHTQKAFVEMGRALRGMGGAGAAAGGGARPTGMDPRAFQMGQIQRRQAPDIPHRKTGGA